MQRTRNQHVSHARLVAGGGSRSAAEAQRWIASARLNAPQHQERIVTNEDICQKLSKSGAWNDGRCLLS